MSWERYLDTIIGLNETGVSAKEVAIEELRLSESDSRRLLSKNRFENYGDQEKGTD